MHLHPAIGAFESVLNPGLLYCSAHPSTTPQRAAVRPSGQTRPTSLAGLTASTCEVDIGRVKQLSTCNQGHYALAVCTKPFCLQLAAAVWQIPAPLCNL